MELEDIKQMLVEEFSEEWAEWAKIAGVELDAVYDMIARSVEIWQDQGMYGACGWGDEVCYLLTEEGKAAFERNVIPSVCAFLFETLDKIVDKLFIDYEYCTDEETLTREGFRAYLKEECGDSLLEWLDDSLTPYCEDAVIEDGIQLCGYGDDDWTPRGDYLYEWLSPEYKHPDEEKLAELREMGLHF